MGNYPALGGLIASTLQIPMKTEEYDALEMNFAYGQMLGLAEAAHQFVDKNSGDRSKQLNLKYIQNVINLLSESTPLTPSTRFTHGQGLHRSIMEHLAALEDNLRAYNDEVVFSEEKIQEMIEVLDELTESVRMAEIDARLKDRMIQILGVVRMQMLRINTVGTNDIMDGLDMYLGQLVRTAQAVDSPEKKEATKDLVDKSMKAIGLINSAVDVGQKVYPLLHTTGKALGWLP